ncbi:hypothetical protein MPC4_110135 [Methylocella tundrae]|uniref:Uncharacterized protein n=1 Tax=Methylocella tundrae TaxID=227605 RepID=A0A4U8Z919_METTU|nr:protein of unknown function [Methylocella tundrae]VTZ48835.1 hypothetical protein MPC4_110135 [Methylocella tundrae]
MVRALVGRPYSLHGGERTALSVKVQQRRFAVDQDASKRPDRLGSATGTNDRFWERPSPP